jgi:hypothetical protein
VEVFAVKLCGVCEGLPEWRKPVVTLDCHDVKPLVNMSCTSSEVFGLYLKIIDEVLGLDLGLEESSDPLASDVEPGYLPTELRMIAIWHNGDFAASLSGHNHGPIMEAMLSSVKNWQLAGNGGKSAANDIVAIVCR